jgi:hypothetical protein
MFKQIVNIEFKAHNVGVSHIMKDLLKLVAEPRHGLFFHTLKTINKGTLINEGKNEGIFDKYKKIIEYKDNFNESTDGRKKFILFAICIIEKKVLLMQTLRESKLNPKDKFFLINYDDVCKANLPKLNRGWTQIRL